MKISAKSQKGLILKYMKDNHKEIIDPSIFVSPWKWSKIPFIGYSASARLVELKGMKLIEKCGEIEGKMTFLFKSMPRNAYRITEAGMDYILKD